MSDNYRTTDLSLLAFEGAHVRYRVDAQGLSWWVAQDVCAILDIKNVSDACARLDADEKDIVQSDTHGGSQELLVVNEPGLYKLLFRSNKTEAKRFQRWVLHDVLPTLRRTGQYQMPPPRQRALDAPREMTVGQIVCFGTVYTHPLVWYTTETLAAASRVSVRRVRDYCRYFADAQLFERIHTHPQKFYRWNPHGIVQAPTIVQAYLQALTALPRDLPGYDVPIWEKESDPRKW